MAKAKPAFFKVIVSPHLQLRQRLMIPKSFVKKYGSCFLPYTDKIDLRVPDSATTWPVDLVKEHKTRNVWLEKGWPEFSKHYLVSLGYFLVFRYEGHFRFCVMIFDTSAAEIDYPNDIPHLSAEVNDKFQYCRVLQVKEDEEEDDDGESNDGGGSGGGANSADDDSSVQILDVESRTRFKKAKSTIVIDDDSSVKVLERDYPCNLNQTHCNVKFRESQEVIEEDGESPRCLKKVKRKLPSSFSYNHPDGAMKRAMSFKSENPHFSVYIWPSYLSKSRLHIPQDFFKKHIAAKVNAGDRTMSLCLQRTDKAEVVWPVKCRLYESSAKLSTGWAKFVSDNDLRVGDVCIFELIDVVSIAYKVWIFRGKKDKMGFGTDLPRRSPRVAKLLESRAVKVEEDSDGADPSVEITDVNFPRCMKKVKRETVPSSSKCCPVEFYKYDEAMKRALTFKSENPHFRMCMKPSYLSHSYDVHIPQRYWESYLAAKHNAENNKSMSLCVQGTDGVDRVWSVKYGMYESAAKLSTGWILFVLDNDLQVGDVCVFELIDAVAIVHKVWIFRAQEC